MTEPSKAANALAAAVLDSPEVSVEEWEDVFCVLPPETWERWADAVLEAAK